MRVLAVDDELPALEDLVRLLEASPAVDRVESAASAEEALVALGDGAAIDAVFLDVRMPGLGGLELARVLRRFEQPPAVVFVSAFDDAAVDAFELAAVDYLRKPVSRRRLDEAIERASRRTPAGETATLEDETLAVDVLRGGGTRLLARSSVLYLQAHGDYVRVASTEGRYLVRARLSDLEERWAAARLRARAPRVRGQPAAGGRGAPAAQRHRRAGHGRRRRGPDRPAPGGRAAPEAGRVSLRDELAEATAHGGLYLRRLIRAQLGLSTVALVTFGGIIGALPLALLLLPGLQDVFVLGVPLPVFIIAWPPFPLFIAIGVIYSRRAAALEESFRDLVEPRE